MKRIYFLTIGLVVLMMSCQKEDSLVTNPKTNVKAGITSSTIPGVTVKQNGFPYPNMETTKSLFGNEDIGWSLDLSLLAQGSVVGQNPEASNLGPSYLYCGGINTVNLYAGQNILMGVISYANDAVNLYVTYTTNPDWYMTEVHLYVGSLANAPLSGGGTPSPGKFPVKSTFTASTLSQDITYVIPLSTIPSGFIIAAHSSVLRVDIDGDVIAKETAWAAGTRFQSNKNWATYVVGTIAGCYESGIVGEQNTKK